MTALTIHYSSSVHTSDGWRNVTITAEAEQISAGTAKVIKVTAIDGEEPTYSMMGRTGAHRHGFYGKAIAAREIAAKKRLSDCRVEKAA